MRSIDGELCMKKSLLLSLLAGLILPVLLIGCSAPEGGASLDEQAQDIYHSLMCPICPGQTIAQSQTELSAQMRAIVREKLEQGETREEILQFFVERYGETVLAAPPKSGFNLVVWLVPATGIILGGVLLWWIVRRWVRREKESSPGPVAPANDIIDGEKYRRQLDRELKDFDERGFR